MENNYITCKLCITGEVVAAIKTGEKNFVKILVNSICTELPNNNFNEIKLGDKVIVQAKILTESICSNIPFADQGTISVN
ncbi:MAG: hypothetical protein NTX22_12290 [Ignavibacteriales bacterium]|nr:hypothetical protein [Ignavibacteriales bacterium]